MTSQMKEQNSTVNKICQRCLNRRDLNHWKVRRVFEHTDETVVELMNIHDDDFGTIMRCHDCSYELEKLIVGQRLLEANNER